MRILATLIKLLKRPVKITCSGNELSVRGSGFYNQRLEEGLKFYNGRIA